jgi:Zn-dependent peptidase ImmA (M78 family)/transcriptional regulator with XRE-family HTH domain
VNESNSRESKPREFVGARLELARTLRGLTLNDVARAVAVSFGLISHYENGRKQPSPDVTAALAELLGVRPDFFFQPLTDPWNENECSFRHRQTTPEKVKRRARAHGTLIGLIVKHLASVLRFPAYDVPEFRGKTADQIEYAAMQCRIHWKLGADTPIVHMGRVLEHAGVVIVQHLEHSDKIDAFSRCGDVAVVVLNTARNSASRSIFDLAHECGHFVLHKGIVTGSPETETEANYFAGAFLLPRKAFSREFLAHKPSWPHIFELKKRWRVSASAIIRRAYQLRLITAIDYRQANKQLSANGWTKQEPHEPEFVGPELLPVAFNAVEKGLGISVASVCEALHLTPQTFLELTGVRAEEPTPTRGNLITFGKTTV